MRTAFVFPGQGSQKPGMGSSLYEASAAARQIWDSAEALTGRPVKALAFDGPEDELRATRNAQIALYVSECAALAALKEAGLNADACAGHSIGEYAALVCAGVMTFEQGLKLVEVRAEAMDQAAAANPGAMAAVLGLDPEAVDKAVVTGSAAGMVQVANYNSPGQIVISGSAEAVAAASAAAMEAGARKVMPLGVSGAFHSAYMGPAADRLSGELVEAALEDPQIPVVLNVTSRPAESAAQIRQLLAQQITSPVRWHESASWLVGQGVELFVEAGPGQVLAGLARRMDPAPETVSVDSPEGVQQAAEAAHRSG